MREGELEDPSQGMLFETSPVVQYFFTERLPLTQFDLDCLPRFSALPEGERQWFASLKADIYVPVFKQSEWLGLLALGPKKSGVPYLEEDQELLSTMAGQTAVALENARLVESLLRLNSDFRRANLALEKANRHLEQLDRTKSDFISVASHELRTPLTVINGYSQMLAMDADLAGNPNYTKMLNGIQTGAERLHEILESLLDIAEIENHILTLDLGQVSPDAVARQAAKKQEKALQARCQTLEIQGLDELPAIEADFKALVKVLNHLLVNAIKYTPDGGRITISGRNLPEGDETLPRQGVELVVSDTGIGIDPALHELIFLKFYHTSDLSLHSTGRTKFKGAGAGLGLTIAFGIVEAHHGRIWVESTGHDENTLPGSHFHVALPLSQPPLSALEDVKPGR